MNIQTISPAKRYLLAGIAYLLVFVSPTIMTKGAVWALIAVVLYTACAYLLLRASAPGLVGPAKKKEASVHPVQAGKARLLRPSRQAVWSRA